MKTAFTIARILLGLLFTVFGLNGFLHFIPMQPPAGLAGQYMGALFVSHYLVVVFLLQLIGGVLLLANRYVPLGLLLLGPVVVLAVVAGSACGLIGAHLAMPSVPLFARPPAVSTLDLATS